jgi:hypothetical protein
LHSFDLGRGGGQSELKAHRRKFGASRADAHSGLP